MNLLIFLDFTYNPCKNFKFYFLQGQNFKTFLIFTYNQGKVFLILPITRGAHVYLVPPPPPRKGDNAELVKKRVCEAIGIIPDVIAIGKEVSNKQFEIKCTLELYNSMLVNKILFNCQSWSHLKKIELKDLEKANNESAILYLNCRHIPRAWNFTT